MSDLPSIAFEGSIVKYRKIIGGIIVIALISLTAGCTNAAKDEAATQGSSVPAPFDASSISTDETIAALVPTAIRDKGVLAIGSDTTYAPAEFLGGDDGQTPIGFDVDLAEAIGAVLGLDVEFNTSEFSAILPALGTKYDLGVSTFGITTERMKAVNFVSYFIGGTSWAVETGNPKKIDLDDLCGKKVGVQTGTQQEDPDLVDRSTACIAAGKDAIEVVSLKNLSDVTTRLIAGGLDAMAAGTTSMSYAVSKSSDQMELLGDAYDVDLGGIAVAKDDLALADATAQAINKLIEEGIYQEILAAWGVSVIGIDNAEVNPTVGI